MLYYLGYYNCDKIRSEQRLVSPASENKMSYVISALENADYKEIEVISPAETKLSKFVKGKKQKITENVFLKTFSSFTSNNKLIRGVGHLLTGFFFAFYLFCNIRSKDHLLVYHSLAYMHLIKCIKAIKKCKLTVEVEELYSDVAEDEQLRKKEINYLQIADSYIFVTDLLRKEVNIQKPSIISHGTYRTVPDFGYSFDDDKIHVVYAGTFNKTKGGAFTAISVAKFLDERYVLEILGDGTDDEIKAIRNKIQEISVKTKCLVNYAGYKFGDEFNSYIQACHIGLSTQQPDAKFNATSFPSKILMYMSNGIRVISVRIPAIETSDVGKYIFYYDDSNPYEIAKSIKSITIDEKVNNRQILNDLNRVFVKQLKSLLNG